MYKQSDAAIVAWRATERTLDGKVTITDSNGNETNYGTSDITSIAYDSGAWTGDTFSIGSTYENNITVTFAHLVEGLKQGYKVTAKIGIKLPDGTYEYCPLGVFIISDEITMDRNNDATTIKAYDQFCTMQGTYTSKLTYPAKITDVIAEIANMSGVELNTDDIAELPTQTDLASAISGQTYCTAIGWIAQFYGGFATFDRDGKLTIRTVTDASYILDASQYEQSGLTKNEATYQIGGMSVSVTTTTTDSTGESSETTSTLTAGETTGSQIELTNNVMTQARLDSIWSAIKDITFYPYSLTWFGNPAIEAGDWLTLKDTAGNSFNVPNNSYTMTFDGGLTATSKADQTSTSSSSYSYSGALSQTVKQLAGRQGATGNYIFGTDTTVEPTTAKIGDLWYKQNGNQVEMWQYVKQSDGTGKWELIVSDATGEEIKANVDKAMAEADTATKNANTAVDTANSALTKAQTAINNAQTASDAANDATTVASNAISQATSASNVANNVNEEITTLKGGSTATIAELEDGLALKLSTSDFDTQIANYATQTWTTDQITATATSLSSTISSVQTQVNNSAVGTNLLVGTSDTLQTVPASSNKYAGGTIYIFTSSELPSLVGQTCTLRVFIHNTSSYAVRVTLYGKSSNFASRIGSAIAANSDGYSTVTFSNTSSSDISGDISIRAWDDNTATSGVQYKDLKLEKGSVATDYSANPADNATVTSVTNLTQTVSSLSTTVSGKVDTTTYTSKITELASSIATKVSQADYNTKITQLSTAIDAKVATTDYNTEVTLLSNQINSKVSQSDWANSAVGVNLVPNSSADVSGIAYGSNSVLGKHSFYNGGNSYLNIIHNTKTSEITSSSGRFFITAGGTYTLSFKAFNNSLLTSCDVWLLGRPNSNTTDDYTVAQQLVTTVKFSTASVQYYKVTFTVKLGIENAYLRFDNNGTSTSGSSADLYFNEVKIETGSTATPWCPAVSEITNYSQIQQLSDNINLRVVKNDVINQINISTEGILIAGNKVHITGSTTIDNAVIKSAMIDSISADKITAGTLNAANVNVINLNANNISSGTLTGVSFHQSSSGHDTWIDGNGVHDYDGSGNNAWIQKGTLQVYDKNGDGFFMDSGKLELTSQYLWQQGQSVKYGLIKLDDDILALGKAGMHIQGYNGLRLDTGHSMFDGLTGALDDNYTGAAINLSDNGQIAIGSYAETWLSAGAPYTMADNSSLTQKPNIYIGTAMWDDRSTVGRGQNIIMQANGIILQTHGEIKLKPNNGDLWLGYARINTGSDTNTWYSGPTGTAWWFRTYGGDMATIHVQSVAQSSLLSLKTNLNKLDPAKALATLTNTDICSYNYKSDLKNGISKTYATAVIDDVNDKPQYNTPYDFISADGTGRDDGTILGYAVAAIQELNSKITSLETEIKQLKGAA
ncbi:gp58-like family protein [Liquorilactobacillus nagelii]|uniref:gp58-like family protein n=1 Tax=Liquorilactobacillus nagelii TaxID=82688 RepID=UPI0006EF7776|nr:gp58-like family protein [Liquorilactobacillus nagelii]KRL39927.1 hypothetical protein FD45_GL000103 [Liquorilactobacillus nagelii DSM 13675]QYH53443.1 hypothetical protein G6O73_01520 [Liquorilactobacillus nagelii DSM 13675]